MAWVRVGWSVRVSRSTGAHLTRDDSCGARAPTWARATVDREVRGAAVAMEAVMDAMLRWEGGTG